MQMHCPKWGRRTTTFRETMAWKEAVEELYTVMLQGDTTWIKKVSHKIYKPFHPCLILLHVDLWCKHSTAFVFPDRERKATKNMAQALATGRKWNYCPRKALLTHLFSWFQASLSPSLLCIYRLYSYHGKYPAFWPYVCHKLRSMSFHDISGKPLYQSLGFGSWSPSGYGWKLLPESNKCKRSFNVLRVSSHSEAHH